MNKLIFRVLLTVVLIGSILVACGTNLSTVLPTAESTVNTQTTAAAPVAASVTEAVADDQPAHDAAEDYNLESADEIAITLNGDSISTESPNVKVEGNIATISAAGTYLLSGTLGEGQIAVDSADKETVRLILNGVDIHNSSSAAINIINAEKVVILLADQSENRLSDGATYLFADAQTDEPNATLFSKADLSIAGNGSLTVEANYNDGIASKDGLVIAGGSFTIRSADDGIRGKDYLVIQNGSFTINAQGDGLKSDDAEDVSKGYIQIENGTFQIVAGGDAIQGETDVTISDGTFTLTSAGGSSQTIAADLSAKGIKAGVALWLKGGEFTIDAADDALHSNTHVLIDGGSYSLATADDGIHADATLTINNGTIDINKSYEGIESAVITINGGDIALVASDDGVNAADGTGGGPAGGGFGGARPQGGGGPRGGGGAPGGENVNYTGNLYLYINGGQLMVDAAGDGLDVNGAVEMSGGVVVVNGPVERMNGPLDYDGYFKMTGGTIIAAGSAGMAQAPGSLSTQNSLLVYLNPAQAAGSAIHIQSSEGEDVLTFVPSKTYQSLAFSSPKLVAGKSYDIYVGGTVSGESTNGVYESATYSGGTQTANFTVTDLVTVIGR